MKSIINKCIGIVKSVKNRINNMFNPRSISRRYYPEIDSITKICKEKCKIMLPKVGSGGCQECKYCIDRDKENHEWIICSKKRKAIG